MWKNIIFSNGIIIPSVISMSELLGQRLMPTRKVTLMRVANMLSLKSIFFSLSKILIIITHKTKLDLFLMCIYDLINESIL